MRVPQGPKAHSSKPEGLLLKQSDSYKVVHSMVSFFTMFFNMLKTFIVNKEDKVKYLFGGLLYFIPCFSFIPFKQSLSTHNIDYLKSLW